LYKNKKILITGGLGFLGSNLAHKFVQDGASVTIVDNLSPLYGGNMFNVEGIKENVKIILGDIRDKELMKSLIVDVDYIFHFAAQVSYIDSLSMPFDDMDLNAKSVLSLLELCRQYNQKTTIVFSSSRMVLGYINGPVFDETHPTNPLSLYGIHKLTAEKYLLMYYKDFGIRCIIYRITNPYGPRQQIKHSKYSLPGWFIRQAMEGKTIKIFGEGDQVRDYVFVNDLIEGIYLASVSERAIGHIVNLGSGIPTRFKDIVETIIKIVGKGKIEHVPWPEDYEKIETGNSVADISKLKTLSGFVPKYSIEDGIKETFDYYLNYAKYYI